MAYIQEIREQLPDNALFYDNPSFDNSIIGYSVDGNPIYDFEHMVLEYMEDEGCSEEDAIDWIDYNTLGASVPSCYSDCAAPIVIYRLEK